MPFFLLFFAGHALDDRHHRGVVYPDARVRYLVECGRIEQGRPVGPTIGLIGLIVLLVLVGVIGMTVVNG